MRIGRQIELLLGAYKTSKSGVKDDVVRMTTMVKQLSFAGWLTFDTISWCQAIGLIVPESDEAKQLTSDRANKLWLAGLTVSILGGMHKLQTVQTRISMEEKAVSMAKSSGKVDQASEENVKKLCRYVLFSLTLLLQREECMHIYAGA